MHNLWHLLRLYVFVCFSSSIPEIKSNWFWQLKWTNVKGESCGVIWTPRKKASTSEKKNLHHKNEAPASQQKSENTVEDRMNMKEPSQNMTLDVKPVENIDNEFPKFKKNVEDDIHDVKLEMPGMQTKISQLNDETKLRSREVETNIAGVQEQRKEIFQLVQDVYKNREETGLNGQKIEKVSKDITDEFANVNSEISQVKSVISELIKGTCKQTDKLSKQMQMLLEKVGDIDISFQVLKGSIAENKTKTHERLAKIEHDLSCVSGTTVNVSAYIRNIDKVSGEKMESLSEDVKNLNDRVQCIPNEIPDIEQSIKEEQAKVNEKHTVELEKEIRELRRVASANSKILNILNKQRNTQSSSGQKRSCDLRDLVLGCVLYIPDTEWCRQIKFTLPQDNVPSILHGPLTTRPGGTKIPGICSHGFHLVSNMLASATQ